jgi:hypothetical protein
MIKQLSFTKQAPDLATPESLKALESKFNFHFPPTFVEFCSRWNGGFPGKDNKFYPVPPRFKEFYDEYEKSKGVYVDTLFGATEKLPHCGLLKECAMLGEFSKLVIPITVDIFGNRAVLRADSPMGLVYWWDHELWEVPENAPPGPKTPERPRLIPIAQDLESFYNSLTFDPNC